MIPSNFPKYFNQHKKKLSIDFKIEDKNPNILMKIYQNNKFEKWVEKYNQNSSSHFCNSFVLFFDSEQKKHFGKIEEINPIVGSPTIQVQLFEVERYNNYALFCITSYLDQRKTVPVTSILYFFSTFNYYSQVWLIPMANRTHKIN